MDKATKTLFEQETKKYAEEKQVYDILENLMRKLIINKPEKPLDFLIEQLQNTTPNFLVFLVGVDYNTEEIANNISLQHSLKRVSVPKLINQEIRNNTELGKKFLKKGYDKKPKRIIIPIELIMNSHFKENKRPYFERIEVNR